MAADHRDRGAVVRALQRRAQQGRAVGRRRHRRDADPGLAGADRPAGGGVPRRAVHPPARPGARARVRRRGPDLAGHLRRRLQRRHRRAALPGQRRRLLDQPDPPEAPRRAPSRRPRHLAGLHRRRGQLPAVRGRPGPRGRRRPGVVAVVAGLPRGVPDRDRVHHLRLRPQAHEREQPRRDHLPGPADHDRAGRGVPRGGPSHDGVRRRRACPGRRLRGPPQAPAAEDAHDHAQPEAGALNR